MFTGLAQQGGFCPWMTVWEIEQFLLRWKMCSLRQALEQPHRWQEHEAIVPNGKKMNFQCFLWLQPSRRRRCDSKIRHSSGISSFEMADCMLKGPLECKICAGFLILLSSRDNVLEVRGRFMSLAFTNPAVCFWIFLSLLNRCWKHRL